jgi:D-glycero-D-manno-heptose 1,7-bisphosphate phosphatase
MPSGMVALEPMDKELLKYSLAIFDIDGTLTEIKPEIKQKQPRLVTPNHLGEQQPISGVVEKLAEIKANRIKLALATNRGGVAFGYTTLEQAQALAQEAADLCQIPDARIYLCPYHAKARGPRAVYKFAQEADCRKPNPGMLLQAVADFHITPQQAFFVGDKDTDHQAAENAGMDFFWADDFFR